MLALIAEGPEFHIPKGYRSVAMAFSGMVETLNSPASSRKQTQRS
jgi:predicted tellurium resistance membrane protein TerC